jgi:osmotically-inducible protein OsmY
MTASAVDAPTGATERSALSGHRAANPKSVELADPSLRRAVLAALTADPMVTTAHIGVVASAGRVILSGHVPTHAQKSAARAAAARVKGVDGVADEIQVIVPHTALAGLQPQSLGLRPPITTQRPQRPVTLKYLDEPGGGR